MRAPLRIRRRPAATADSAFPGGLHPLVARIYALRGLTAEALERRRLAHLAAPAALGGMQQAVQLLAAALAAGQRICVVGDFDADGATGTAVAVRGLRLLGARGVSYRVPNRLTEGYGLSVALVEDLAAGRARPDLLLTVDNGISSHEGVAAAHAHGMRVLVTDHHVPGPTLPAAEAIVNPNLPGDAFPSKALAGVGVVFYLLLALRAHLREAGAFQGRAEPDLGTLLDLVALGTVADLVPLDANNRILVEAGLKRIRSRRACAGVLALFDAAGRDPARAVAADLGFAIGPRINAAGRLEDMGLGIECLLADDPGRAARLAAELTSINAQRQELQAGMVEEAEAQVARFLSRWSPQDLPCGIVLHDEGWHPGVVGLVASRLKERLHRPVVAFAPADDGRASLRGSARSIPGFHLRDALADVDAAEPGLIERFGGHAMAAGLTLAAPALPAFAAAFDALARQRLDAAALEHCIWSDGELAMDEFCPHVARELRYAGPWGQAFPEPAFDNEFEVQASRIVGGRHLRLDLRPPGSRLPLQAILFDGLEHSPPPARIRAVFHLDLNHWNGEERLQLLVRHIEPA